MTSLGFPGSSTGKASSCNAGDLRSIPGSGRSPGEGIGYPLQYSWVSVMAQMVKNWPIMQKRPGFNPWVGKIPWGRKQLPTSVFLPRRTEKIGRLQSMGSQGVGHD